MFFPVGRLNFLNFMKFVIQTGQMKLKERLNHDIQGQKFEKLPQKLT